MHRRCNSKAALVMHPAEDGYVLVYAAIEHYVFSPGGDPPLRRSGQNDRLLQGGAVSCRITPKGLEQVTRKFFPYDTIACSTHQAQPECSFPSQSDPKSKLSPGIPPPAAPPTAFNFTAMTEPLADLFQAGEFWERRVNALNWTVSGLAA